MKILSCSNPRVKFLKKLQSKTRESEELFVVEGTKEIQMALKGSYVPVEIFICESIIQSTSPILDCFPKETYIDSRVFSSLAYRKTSGGLIALFEKKKQKLNEVRLSKTPLIWVLESIEKPGNLGAMLRSADALKVEAIMVCDKKVDFFNPNVIRSSIGAVFTCQLVSETAENILNWLKKESIPIFATALRKEAKNIYNVSLDTSLALVLGSESSGLSDFWINKADELIQIPMYGEVDSLNVSNAAAVISFEVVRQRLFKTSL